MYGQVTDYDDDNYPTESLIFNMADMSLMSNPALGSGDYLYGFSPDMMQMVFLSNRDGNYDIYVADADGSNVNRLTSSESIERIIGWSPDSTKNPFRFGPE